MTKKATKSEIRLAQNQKNPKKFNSKIGGRPISPEYMATCTERVDNEAVNIIVHLNLFHYASE